MTNTIGKVKLNDDCYMGYDEEHGTDTDDMLLALFNKHMDDESYSGWMEREIEERKSWDVLFPVICATKHHRVASNKARDKCFGDWLGHRCHNGASCQKGMSYYMC